MEIISSKGTLTGEDIKADQCYLLLAYLILNHKKNFSVDTLAEIICPYDELDSPYKVVNNIVYRLRRTLSVIGLDKLVIGKNGTFQINPNFNIHTDFDRFEDACIQLKTEENPDMRHSLYHSAVDMYKGQLLPRCEHENYDALERYPVKDWHGGKVHRIRSHVLHLMRGQVFELEGYHFFTMGGAKSHDTEDGILEPGAPDFERKFLMLQRKPRARYRINHISWWAQEMPSEEEYAEARKNLPKVDWAVDYVITHCAPTSIALMENRHNEADPLTDFLQEVKERAHYHYWLFGHYHDNRAIDEKHILLWEQIVQVI